MPKDIRTIFGIVICALPSVIKVWIYRAFFGYEIEPGVRIGLSIITARRCRIGKDSRIGHFNFIGKMARLCVGADVVIGHFNVVLGGELVEIGDGAMIGRLNEINSILNPLVRGEPTPRLRVGRKAVITASHKIDFTDSVTIEESAILAGRLSNLWTHNRQGVGPVRIGANCYVGSGIQMVPGSEIGRDCVVGLGSVVTKKFSEEGVLIAGVPAKVIKPLDEESRKLVTFTTRPDLDGVDE